MQHAQLQGNAVSPQFEGVIHLLDDQFGVIEDLDNNAVRASAQLNRAGCGLYPGRVRKTHLVALLAEFVGAGLQFRAKCVRLQRMTSDENSGNYRVSSWL